MDYKEKVIALLNSQELSKEQKEKLENIFPELKESEDERMRNAAINACKYMVDNFENSTKQYEDAIVWLENQSKQKPSDVRTTGYWNVQEVEQELAWSEKYIADVFKKVGLAKIVREQSNDNLTNALQDAMIELSKFIPQPNPAWNEEDVSKIDTIIGYIASSAGEKLGTLLPCINWLKSLKDKVLPLPKQEWSEEDERQWNNIWDVLDGRFELSKEGYKNAADWFLKLRKSLRPQNRWKPSDAQMASITCAVRKMKESAYYDSELVSLLNDLKKLREE